MKLAKPLMISLIIIMPLMIFLSAAHLAGFNGPFYKEEFSKYNVEKNAPDAVELHRKVVDYIKGKSDYLPDRFNEREKKHLHDVRRLVLLSKAALYSLTALAGILVILSARKIWKRRDLEQFVGSILLLGGLLTLALSALLLLSINSNFSSSFESFHKIFFQQGTYAFDPDYEVVVNLYPEELFMDLGLRIAKGIVITSLIIVALGIYFLFKPKKQK